MPLRTSRGLGLPIPGAMPGQGYARAQAGTGQILILDDVQDRQAPGTLPAGRRPKVEPSPRHRRSRCPPEAQPTPTATSKRSPTSALQSRRPRFCGQTKAAAALRVFVLSLPAASRHSRGRTGKILRERLYGRYSSAVTTGRAADYPPDSHAAQLVFQKLLFLRRFKGRRQFFTLFAPQSSPGLLLP